MQFLVLCVACTGLVPRPFRINCVGGEKEPGISTGDAPLCLRYQRLRCIKDWYAAAEPSCYVLRPIVYIVGCLCELIIAASCACVCKSIC